MKVATWNVNGIRARQAQLLEFLARERPDVVCLQEIKASPDQLTFELRDLEGYWSHWHGEKGYSGVALLVSRDFDRRRARDRASRSSTSSSASAAPRWRPPPATSRLRRSTCPTAARTSLPRCAFSRRSRPGRRRRRLAGRTLVFCGDLNVARSDMDIHPKERKPNQVGARPDERAALRADALARSGRCRPRARSGQRQPVHLVGAVAQPAAAQHRLAHRLRARESRRSRQRRRAPSCTARSARATTDRWS